MNSMKAQTILVIAAAILSGCEARVTPVPAAVPVRCGEDNWTGLFGGMRVLAPRWDAGGGN